MSEYSTFLAAYDANLGYDTANDGAGDRAKAIAFVDACRGLLPRLGKMRHDMSETDLDPGAIAQEMREALTWLRLHPASGAGTIGADLSEYRG